MNINNGFNVLPWYDSLEKQNSKKWYAYGQAWPLLCPQGSILPFQFICDSAITITSTIYAVNAQTGASVNLGVTPTVTKITRADATYYLVKLNSVAVTSLPIGRYNLRMNTSIGYLYSEEITIIDNASECIKLEYWNEDTLRFTSGEINFDDNFHFILYINSTIGKPEYEFEEELTKRLGYKFIESQTSNKLYKFAFAAPEYICDALRLVRMCDYIKLTTKYDSYNALSFAYEPKWQEQGDLAAVDVEFDTDCIIQKLESFNRRVKESFYNALLADIDEPVLFSTDTVAQYYTEYTSVSSINGKLIRQLNAISPIELQDNFDSLVLALDNQADAKQEAKKVFLSDILGLVDSVSKLFKGHYDGAGNLLWIEALSHIGVNGGLTMYIDNGKISLPSLYAGLPIDRQTLVWKDGVLKINPNIELGGGLDEAELYNYLTNNDYAKKSDITTALNGYATTSSLNAVSTKLNDFLEGSDTDTVISKWKELETFLSGLTESDNLATILTGKADKSYVDTNFVTIAGTEDVIGLHNFVNGLKIGGLPITKKQDDVVYLDANLVVRGGITMYAENEVDIPSILDSLPIASNTALGIASFDSTYFSVDSNGMVTLTSAPSSGASYLGKLDNVDDSIDATATVDRVLYQPAGSAMWTWRELPKDGVVGDYLPLSGGTLTNTLKVKQAVGLWIQKASTQTASSSIPYIRFGKYTADDTADNTTVNGELGVNDSKELVFYKGTTSGSWLKVLHEGNYSDYALPLSGGTLIGGVVIAPSASYTTAITDSCTVLKLGSDTSSMNGYNSGLGFNALQRYSSNYLQHLHAWIGLSPCIDSEGSELYDLIFATNGSTTVKTSPIERMRITHDGSVKIQNLFFGNTNEINSTDGTTLCLNYEGKGNILMSNNGQGVIVASGWNGLSSTTHQRLRQCMFSVRGGIFSYMEDVISNAAAYVFDKPGMHFTGIGSNGEANTIYFGAVDSTNLYSWVSYSQIWKFGGSIVTTGGITMYSDIRKKTILNHVELSLKQIADAPLIEHYYNSDQEKTTHVGSIAQYWAGLNDWFCKLDADGFYTMEIQNCALASAISIARHLEKYESKTDKKIRMLKKRVQELEEEVERIKQN